MSGPHPIRISEIESYLNLVNVVDPAQREQVMRVVAEFDNAWLDAARALATERAEKAKREAEAKAKGRRKRR